MNNLDFPIIQQELNYFDSILDNTKLLSDIDFEQVFFAQAGIALVQAQRIEFAMLGVISHIDAELLKKDRNFNSLDPKRFISTDPLDSQYRKQTLGVLVSFFKRELKMFSTEKLDEYLQMRNTLVHNFWRQYLSHDRGSIRGKKEEGLNFIIKFQKLSTVWDSIFKGFLYNVARYLAKEENKNIKDYPAFISIEKHEATLLASFTVWKQDTFPE